MAKVLEVCDKGQGPCKACWAGCDSCIRAGGA